MCFGTGHGAKGFHAVLQKTCESFGCHGLRTLRALTEHQVVISLRKPA